MGTRTTNDVCPCQRIASKSFLANAEQGRSVAVSSEKQVAELIVTENRRAGLKLERITTSVEPDQEISGRQFPDISPTWYLTFQIRLFWA